MKPVGRLAPSPHLREGRIIQVRNNEGFVESHLSYQWRKFMESFILLSGRYHTYIDVIVLIFVGKIFELL